jgi:hypothetical protein
VALGGGVALLVATTYQRDLNSADPAKRAHALGSLIFFCMLFLFAILVGVTIIATPVFKELIK